MRSRVPGIAPWAIAALAPAALNIASPAGASIAMSICTGDGAVHVIQVPLAPGQGPGNDTPCCVKGCHAGSSRKRAHCG